MIYLVDDDPIQNMLTSKLIGNVDDSIPIQIYQNGEEVLDALGKTERPDIILLDINMPIMDGWEFLAEYKNKRNQAKVVMLTSSSMNEDKSKSDGFSCVVDYYTKPITEGDIKEIIKKYY